MPFTDEDKKELSRLIVAALDTERERRRTRYLDEQKANPPKLNTKLYLITIGAHERIAFPDERGRAVLNDVFYARVTVEDGKSVSIGLFSSHSEIEVVAYGDGKLLTKPHKLMLSHQPHMVEIEEGFLETA